MAWDPNAAPWEWDTRAVFQGHGVDFGTRKQSHWPNETEFRLSAAKNECPQSVEAPFPMEPSTSDIHITAGASAQGNLLSVQQHPRLPIVVAASLANEAFGLDWNESCEGVSARNIVTHKSAGDSWKKISDESTGFLELGSHGIHGYSTDKHLLTAHTSKDKSIVADSEGKLPFHPEQQGKLPLGTSHDAIDGGGGGSTEERHSSTTATGSGGSGDSLIGLHLGKRTYFQDVAGGAAGAKASQKATNAAPKKPRAAAGVLQPPRCQVQGCETDLTSAKDYHRRHKVCEPHSKAGKVVVANIEKRFCQQCSRFHVLSEFDDAKRSCRRRLQGHNERRRKPQIDTSLWNSRFHSTLADWPFLHQPKFHSLSSLWQDSGDFSSTWNKSRIGGRTDQSMYDYTVQAGGLDQPCLNGLLPPTYDNKHPLLLLQSPKGMMSDDTASSQRAHYHQYLSGYMVPVGSNLSLASSTSLSGALAGFSAFDTTPVTQVVTRVSDSGRALSLLSLPTRADHHHASSTMVSRNMSARTTSITFDQLMNQASTSQQYQNHERQQLHPMEYTNDKLLSMASTETQEQGLMCTTNITTTGGFVDHCEGAFMHGLNIGVGGGFENHLCLSTLHEHDEVRAPEDVKQTIDLMPNSSFQSHDAQSMVAFQLGATTPVDLQYSYESSSFF